MKKTQSNILTKKRALCLALERRAGFKVYTPADFARLSGLIFTDTHQYVSQTTLKRLFGYIEGWQTPRPGVWDILCRYVGYANEEAFSRAYGLAPEAISGQVNTTSLPCREISMGAAIRIEWYPSHRIEAKYLGDCRFEITEAHGTALTAGGTFYLSTLVQGSALLLLDYKPTPEADPIIYEIGRQGGICFETI